MRLPSLLAVLLAVPAAALAADLNTEAARLREAADFISVFSQDDYQEAFRGIRHGGNPRLRYFAASRDAALNTIYRSLAAVEYKRAAAAAPTQDASAASVSAQDAEALAVNPESLEKASWWSAVSEYINQPAPRRYHGTAVAAVRGGRKIETPADKQIAKMKRELRSVNAALAIPSLTPEKKASLHRDAARLYEETAALIPAEDAAMASAGKEPAPKAESAPKAKTEAAPAAEYTPKEIYQHFAPGVVLVMSLGRDGKGEMGTGSVVDESGRVLTNAHVVIRESSQRPFETIRIYLKPARLTGDSRQDLERPIEARVAGYDRALDLAILELTDRPDPLRVIPIGDADTVESGDPVVAIGHPEQGGLWTLTTGVVSTVLSNLGGVKGKDVFQTDASINRGNSGGPLLSRRGYLIGVNTSMARKAPDGLTITSVNFAVKSDVVKRWLASAKLDVAYQEPGAAAPAPIAETRPAPAKPAEPVARPEPAVAAERPQTETKAQDEVVAEAKPSRGRILTPEKPFKIDDLIESEMKEMDDLEDEMRGEIDKRRAGLQLGQPSP